MPVTFFPFSAFMPDGGHYGRELDRYTNVLPIHQGARGLRQKKTVATVEDDGPVTGAHVHIFAALEAKQYGRPISNYFASFRWYPLNNNTGQLWEQVDEEVAQDSDAILSGSDDGHAGQVKFGFYLTPMETPSANNATVLRVRYRVHGSGGAAWEFTVGLDTGMLPREISGTGDVDYTNFSYTLSTTEHDAILDWTTVPFVCDATDVDFPNGAMVPSADSQVNGWRTQAGSASSLYATIDGGTSTDDTDYVRSPILTTAWSAAYRFKLADNTQIFKGEDVHTLKVRHRETNDGVEYRASLYKGPTLIETSDAAASAAAFATADAIEIDPQSSGDTSGFEGAYSEIYVELQARYDGTTAASAFQKIYPDSLVHNVRWGAEGAANTWSAIDDDPADNDADYIECAGTGAGETITLGLETPEDPQTTKQHTVVFRWSAPSNVGLQCALLSGATVIATKDVSGTGLGVIANSTITLTEAQVAQLHYGSARLKFTAQDAATIRVYRAYLQLPEPRRLEVSEVYLELPPPGGIEVTWVELETPVSDSRYLGDDPTIIAGTRTKLYEADETAFTDISKAGDYAGSSPLPGAWHMCSFGEHIVATNYTDAVQWREDNSGDFKDLMASTLKPKCRFVAPARSHLMIGGVNPATAGHESDEVWWSAFEDITDFDPDVATQCDYQRLVSTPGQLMGLVGGEEVLAFKRRSLYVLQWVGDAIVWRPDLLSASIGTPYPRSIVQGQGEVFFWGGECFYRLPAPYGFAPPQALGRGIISRFLTDAEFSDGSIKAFAPSEMALEDQAMIGAWDPHSGLIVWTYQGRDDDAWKHSRAVVYNPAEDRWSLWDLGDENLSLLIQRPNTLDASTHFLKGLIGFDWDGTDSTWFRFDGQTTYEATFRTKRFPIAADGEDMERPKLVRLKGVLPVFSLATNTDWPQLSITVEASFDPRGFIDLETQTYGTANQKQWFPFDLSGVWFRITVTVPEMAAKILNAFEGVYLDWEFRGGGGD